MKIDKRLYRYIEYELYHYEQYKKDIETERELILESSPSPPDGQPRGTSLSNVTEDKALRLTGSVSIAKMERTIRAIDRTLLHLTDTHRQLFNKFYARQRKDRYKMCDELGIAEATFTRYKFQLIEATGIELGIISVIKS